MTRARDLAGQRFGSLVALDQVESRNGRAHWLCTCDCGNTKVIAAHNLRSGHTSTCGHNRPALPASRVSRGKRATGYTPEYRSWMAMRERCNNSARPNYRYYGGRGITVCPEWDSFERFRADMGPRPEGTTLDRIDNSGNYEPGNRRWADWTSQNRTKRVSVDDTSRQRLTPDRVRELRRRHAAGERPVDLAAAFGISGRTVWRVVTGRAWQDVA